MTLLSDDIREKILDQIEERGMLFDGFGFVKENDSIVTVGEGSFSYIYAAYAKGDNKGNYAIKVDGFGSQIMNPERFRDNFRIQHALSLESQYILRVIAAKELDVVDDEEGKVFSIKEISENEYDKETEGRRVQVVLMERAEPVLKKDIYGQPHVCENLLSVKEEVISFAYQIGEAIRVAHMNHVLHRDIKLENIFWDEFDGVYKLGDFGTARYADEGVAETVIYSDGYGAPEIERSLGDNYDVRADIYSFGISLYLLLNDLKFPGSDGYYCNPVQYDRDYVFPAPAHATEAMTDVILRMTGFRPGDRYQNMDDVLKAFGNLTNESNVRVNDDVYTDIIEETEFYSDEDEEGQKISRAERKEQEKQLKSEYASNLRYYTIIGTIVVCLLLRGAQNDYTFCKDWHFFIFPLSAAVQMIFAGMHENRISGTIFAVAVGVYSAVSTGLTLPHILIIVGILSGYAVLELSSVLGTWLWMLIMFSGRLQWLSFIQKHDFGWIALVLLIYIAYKAIIVDIKPWDEYWTEKRSIVSIVIYSVMPYAMIVAGIIITILNKTGVSVMPDFIERLHLIRTGVICAVVYCLMGGASQILAVDEEKSDEPAD